MQRPDVDQSFLQTEARFPFVMDIVEYWPTDGNPAAAYVAGHLSVGLEELHEQPGSLGFRSPCPRSR